MKLLFVLEFLLLCSVWQQCKGEALQLIPSNVDQVLGGNELVFVNFYADWCRFSQMLKPIFEEAAQKVKEEFQEEGKVTFAKVDCDKQPDLAKKYHVSKYPTLKVFRQGSLMKREYRGQRSASAFQEYIRTQLKDPVEKVEDMEHYDNLDRKKRHIIGYFDAEESPDYTTFRKVASLLQDECRFHASFGKVSEDERLGGNKVVYKPIGEHKSDMAYSGRLSDHNIMLQWTTDKCVPLVREITFENAEELTEEGLPFMILFHNVEDTETPEKYQKMVAMELMGDKSSINFLTADGLKFTHPLYHLGKTSKDLPLVAIDSFRHMYLWKEDPKTSIEKPGLLKQFIQDLHSGKLHREFHNPPAANAQGGDQDNTIEAGDSQVQVKNGDDQPAAFHLDISQQVITDNNGFQLRVMKIMQHEGAVHIDEIKEELEQIEAKTEKEEAQKESESRESETGGSNESETVKSETGENEPNKDKSESQNDINRVQNQQREDMTEQGGETPPTVVEKVHKVKGQKAHPAHVPNTGSNEGQGTDPPESSFAKLGPSKSRYSFQRDEL